MNRKIIKVIIPILIVVEISFLFLTFMSYSNKDIDKLKEVSKIDKKMFTMYKQNDNDEYDLYDSEYWPGSGYILNEEKTLCVDKNDNPVTDVITYNDGKITVTSNKTVYCTIYFDIKIDVFIKVNTVNDDGTTTNEVAPTLGYKKDFSCNKGSIGSWDYKYNRLVFENVVGDEEQCDLTYTKDTNEYPKLINLIENDDEVGGETFVKGVDFSTIGNMSQEEYGSYSFLLGNSLTSASATTVPDAFVFDSTTLTWNSNIDVLEKYKIYHFVTSSLPAGEYEICHNDSSAYFYININDTTYKGDTSNYPDCVKVSLKTGDKLSLVIELETSLEIGFYMKKSNNVEVTHNVGYRYKGTNPNNYVWFNNELWRIIGSVPIKINESTTKNLVKIVRKDILNKGYASTSGNTSTVELLNKYYFDGDNDNNSDASSTGCLVKGATYYGNCNYSFRGILPNDIYGEMIEEVFWNTGKVNPSDNVAYAYIDELNDQEKNVVGLLSASDYALSTSISNTLSLDNHNSSDITLNSWLVFNENILLLNSHKLRSGTLTITEGKVVSRSGWGVLPVVYLDDEVFVINENMNNIGSELNPYQIAL